MTYDAGYLGGNLNRRSSTRQYVLLGCYERKDFAFGDSSVSRRVAPNTSAQHFECDR
jgi:hypothetical protein